MEGPITVENGVVRYDNDLFHNPTSLSIRNGVLVNVDEKLRTSDFGNLNGNPVSISWNNGDIWTLNILEIDNETQDYLDLYGLRICNSIAEEHLNKIIEDHKIENYHDMFSSNTSQQKMFPFDQKYKLVNSSEPQFITAPKLIQVILYVPHNLCITDIKFQPPINLDLMILKIVVL